jgi:hypothetical protein
VKKRSLKGLIEDASRARSDLNIFYGVIAILEGGTITADSDQPAQRIISICQAAGQRCLVRMDRAVAAALAHDGKERG